MQTATIRIGPDRKYDYTYIRRNQVEDAIDILTERLRFCFRPGAIINCTRNGLDVVVTFDEDRVDLSYIRNVFEIMSRVLDEIVVDNKPCEECGELFCCHCWSS